MIDTTHECVFYNHTFTDVELLEFILGKRIDTYCSVFNQFEEEEFQEATRYYDEWFQVYTDGFEDEPTYNAYIIHFKDGSLVMIEGF